MPNWINSAVNQLLEGRHWIAYIIVLLATTVIGAYLLAKTDIAETTKVTDLTYPAGGGTPTKTTETTTAIPVIAVITALTAGGWLVLPLTYLWDEASKRNEASRGEIRAVADHRREVSTAMRTLIHTYVEQYYAPWLYRMGLVKKWAKKLDIGVA